jgi:hypothetical protein
MYSELPLELSLVVLSWQANEGTLAWLKYQNQEVVLVQIPMQALGASSSVVGDEQMQNWKHIQGGGRNWLPPQVVLWESLVLLQARSQLQKLVWQPSIQLQSLNEKHEILQYEGNDHDNVNMSWIFP